jgi:hypothetical protein
MTKLEEKDIQSVLNTMAHNFALFREASQKINQYEHLKDKTYRDFYEEYLSKAEFKIGRNYVKLIHDRSAVGFIVINEKDKKFKYADLLKTASWNAPARNFAGGKNRNT